MSLRYHGSLWRKQSRFDEANKVHIKGYEIATGLCDTIEMIAALNNLGTNYRRMGDLCRGNGYHYRALKLSDTYSDHDSPEAIKMRVKSLNGIGNIELEMCRYAAADSVLRLALQGEQRLNSYLGMAINYANLGVVKHAYGDIDSAWVFYRKSLEMNQMAGSQEGEALCHLHFGEMYEEEQNFSHAKEEYKLAYDKLKEVGDSYHWLESCIPLAGVCVLLGEQEEARHYLQEAEAEALRINSLEHQAGVYKCCYNLALLEGNTQNALNYHVKSEALYDSIYGLEKNEQMRQQRFEYENDVKNGEVVSLNNDISNLKQTRNWMIVFTLMMLLMLGGIIAALAYAMRVRTRTQRMLRQVEETRSLFFTNVVHQLRTPLTAIMGATDSIVADSADPDGKSQRENVEVIERQGKNLLELVDRILEVGSVRSAIREPEWRTGDLETFVRMVVESYRERCVDRHIELTYVPCESGVDIDTVPHYLETILSSYIENAINYSKDYSKITVTSSIDKNMFTVQVADNGIGIAKNDLPHVFEPFFRGAVAERMVDGVGIGLTVARDMAMTMGGSVGAESKDGQGSVFTVSLPCKHGNAVKRRFDNVLQPVFNVARRRPDQILENEHDVIVDGALPVVMVVEDHADVARLIGRVLEAMCSVVYASDGEQALAKMRKQRPDLIITDIKMPMMDGYELCRRLRASSSDKLRAVPIIMLSARNADSDRVRGIESGVDAYLVKPFVREELTAWVKRLLESRNAWRNYVNNLENQRVEDESESDLQIEDTDADDDAVFLKKFRQEVDQQMAQGVKLDLDKIALSFRMGESQLKRKVRRLTGKSMANYITQLRMEKAMQLLKSRPDLRVGDVAEQCGFMDVAYFSRVFRQHYGMTPTVARNGE